MTLNLNQYNLDDLYKICGLLKSFHPIFARRWKLTTLDQKCNFIIRHRIFPWFLKYRKIILNDDNVEYFLDWAFGVQRFRFT